MSSGNNPTTVIHFAPADREGAFFPRGTIGRVADTVGEDMPVAFSRGTGSYAPDGEDVLLWSLGDTAPQRQDLSDVLVIRDYNGGLARSAVGQVVNRAIPMLNGTAVREFDDKAYAAASGVYGERHLPTFVMPTGDDIAATLGSLKQFNKGGDLFFKPTRAYHGAGAMRTDREATLETILQTIKASEKAYVAQPVIDSTMPLPSSIQFMGEISQEIAKNRRNSPKEMRIFWFYGRSPMGGASLDWLPVARFYADQKPSGILEEIDDKYVYVDADSVPPELIELTTRFCQNISASSGQNEVSGAFDFVYGKLPHDNEPQWYVMEGNFFQPVPPKEPSLNRQFVHATAQQMIRVANSRVGN